jgi:hypothetical protein
MRTFNREASPCGPANASSVANQSQRLAAQAPRAVPHLHFQVVDQPSLLFSDGLPYVFDRFDVSEQTPPLATTLKLYDTLEAVPIDTANAGPRRNAMPLSRDVVTFPRAVQ